MKKGFEKMEHIVESFNAEVVQKYKFSEIIYENPLSTKEEVEKFKLEGKAYITFPRSRMRMESVMNQSEGQKANFVIGVLAIFLRTLL